MDNVHYMSKKNKKKELFVRLIIPRVIIQDDDRKYAKYENKTLLFHFNEIRLNPMKQ